MVPIAGCLVGLLATLELAPAADQAWIWGEARYNLRRAPGEEYRAVDLVKSGDEVTVLEEVSGWFRVRTASGSEGWIDEDHLRKEAPPHARVAQLESELAAAQAELARERQAGTQLRTAGETLRAETSEAQAESMRLRAQVESLRFEGRWREWLTGGAIVVVGMMIGAVLHRMMARRGTSRLRL
jgi:uncharacterized protein YgiM (DUF1202 family)